MHLSLSPRIGAVAVGWGVLFAIVHAYWATGGAAGTNGDPADTPGVQVYIAFIAVLGFVGAAVAHGLVSAQRPGRTLVLLARAGGGALLLGVAFGTGKWLSQGSLDGDGAAGVAVTLYFLAGGVLFSMLGWLSLRR